MVPASAVGVRVSGSTLLHSKVVLPGAVQRLGKRSLGSTVPSGLCVPLASVHVLAGISLLVLRVLTGYG